MMLEKEQQNKSKENIRKEIKPKSRFNEIKDIK